MKEMMNWLKEEESGQGMVEYALILGLVSIIAIAAVKVVGEKVLENWTNTAEEMGGTVE